MPRRTRRTAKQWQTLIREFDASSVDAETFCQQHQLGLKTFHRWRYRFSIHAKILTNPRGFVELQPVASKPTVKPASSLSLHLGNRMHLELPLSMPATELAALLKAVARA